MLKHSKGKEGLFSCCSKGTERETERHEGFCCHCRDTLKATCCSNAPILPAATAAAAAVRNPLLAPCPTVNDLSVVAAAACRAAAAAATAATEGFSLYGAAIAAIMSSKFAASEPRHCCCRSNTCWCCCLHAAAPAAAAAAAAAMFMFKIH